jgi:putative ABC transport system substrate-binding protein
MRRREFIAGIGGAAAWPLVASAQELVPGKWRIGVLAPEIGMKALLEGLRERGYVEHQNLIIDRRYDDKRERLDVLAAEIVAMKPDIIVAGGTLAVLAAQQATKTIPIVFAASNPVGNGLVQSLGHPGGNITGMSLQSPDLSGKRLELLQEIAGKPSKIAILMNPDDPPAVNALKETLDAAHHLNLQVMEVEARTPDDFAPAFEKIALARPGALAVLTSALMSQQAPRIAELALRLKLPSIYPEPRYAKSGGLVSYGPDFLAIIKNGTYYMDRILKGAKPADLPVEQPTKFELFINLKTAKILGLDISPSLLARADEVIE